jgi:hypothetical protein
VAAINEWLTMEDTTQETQMKGMGTAEQFCIQYEDYLLIIDRL